MEGEKRRGELEEGHWREERKEQNIGGMRDGRRRGERRDRIREMGGGRPERERETDAINKLQTDLLLE